MEYFSHAFIIDNAIISCFTVKRDAFFVEPVDFLPALF